MTSQSVDQRNLRLLTIKGGAFLFGRQLVSIVLKFIGVLLISRVLGPARYGAFVAAFNIYLYALSVGQIGIGVALLRQAGELDRQHLGTAYVLLTSMLVVLVTVLELSRDYAAAYIGVAEVSDILKVLVFAIPFQVLAVVPTAWLERNLNYRAVAIIEVSGQLVYYATAVPLVLTDHGPVSLAYAWMAQQAFALVTAHLFSKQVPTLAWRWDIAKEMIGFAGSFSVANWIWQLRMLVNPLIVGPVLGAYAVGIVGMTAGIMEMLSFVKTLAWRLSVATLSKVQHDAGRLRTAITEGMELQTLAVGVAMLAFGWFGEWLIPMIFGARWLPVLTIYPFVALSYLTQAPFNMQSATMSVLRKNGQLAIYHILNVGVFAAVTALGVRYVGMTGYGLGEIASIPTYFLLHHFVAKAVKSPDYTVTAIWWTGAALGLFWRELGLWTIAMPFLALLAPPSYRRLLGIARLLFPRLVGAANG